MAHYVTVANDIMDEYTAPVCAKGGDLLSGLRASHPDQLLMKGAGARARDTERARADLGTCRWGHQPDGSQRWLRHVPRFSGGQPRRVDERDSAQVVVTMP